MDQKGKFVSGEKKSFKAQGKKKAVDVIIPPGLAKKYEVEEKLMPDNLPDRWENYQLTWYNNIGLKRKPGTQEKPDDYFEVQILKGAEIKGKKEIIAVYWDGWRTVEFPKSDYADVDDETMAIRLNQEDPPIGLGGR